MLLNFYFFHDLTRNQKCVKLLNFKNSGISMQFHRFSSLDDPMLRWNNTLGIVFH